MESLLLAIMPAAAGTSFQKRSGVPTVVIVKSRLKTLHFSNAFTEWALCHCSSDCYCTLFYFLF